MSWGASILVAFLTAGVCAVGGGFVASLCVDWYRVTSREGASGYFVLFMGLLGAAVGFVLGLIVSRVVAASATPGFFPAFGTALGVSVTILVAIALVARLLADVPPQIAGEELFLQVEVRCPPGRVESPAVSNGPAFLSLGSRSGSTVRAMRKGALFTEDARIEDGRWVVPGAVNLFTGRGKRMIGIQLGETEEWFDVPLPGSPGERHLVWSDWWPQPRPGGGPATRTNTLAYRFRVLPRNQPVRTAAYGPFEMSTIAGSIQEDSRSRGGISASSSFRIRHGGQPVDLGGQEVDQVVAVPAPRPALLARSTSGTCLLVEDTGGEARSTPVAQMGYLIDLAELRSGATAALGAAAALPSIGFFDRGRVTGEGLFLVGSDAVLDTRRLATHKLPLPQELMLQGLPPLGVSPDERSLVRFVYVDGTERKPALAVTDFVAGQTYALRIDRARMRYSRNEKLDSAWVLHHFRWAKGEDGTDRLVEREGFVPLPYKGDLTTDPASFRVYQLEPAGEEVRTALVEFLKTELGAETIPVEGSGSYAIPMRVDGQRVSVNCPGDFSYVSVTPEQDTDSAVLAKIAERFDAALATGRYDPLFVDPRGEEE